MYPKRRITVQPVDAARLCGDNNGAVVSFLNCINHRVTDTPTTDLDEPLYLPSRVMVHAYAGALLVDAAVEAHQYIEEAAVNAAAVVACRVMPLRASGESSSATYSAHAGGPTKIVFFSGCQRLAEVLIDDVAAVTSSSPMRMNSCPMQCFRVEFGGSAKGMVALDMATFLKDPQTLCACTPQLGKIQMLSFEGDAISCMGPGRPGSAEVTVILSSNVAVLCGVPPTALEPWTSSAEEDPEEPAVLRASRAARQTFLAANEHSSTQVLQTIPLPSHLSSSATPLRVAWSGAATLWAIYSDGSVVAVQCVEREGIDNSAEDDDELQRPSLASSGARPASQARCSLVVSQVLETKLAAVCAQNSDFNELVIGQAEIHADPRAPALHFAVVTTDAGGTRQQHLYYGTVRLQVASAAAHLQLRQYQIRYGEQLYGVRFERGRFHILSQSTRGAGPLYVVTLPKDGPSVSSAEAGAASDAPSLAKTIMECAESELSSYCRNCEALLKELRAKAQQLTCEQDAELLLKRLMEAQHALYALLTRQQQSVGVKDLAPNESLPYRLLQRASQLFCELSVYTLFVHLGIMDTISRPVRDVLRLSEAAAMSEKAQTQWASLIRDTFRHESVYQSSVAEMAAWQAAATLCVDVLLDRLGLSAADASCTMTSVLARIGALTPDMALFILYYSYVGLEKGGGAKSAPATSSRAVQQQQRQWRESFLLLFSMPVELSLWAFTCYAVDHGVNPAKVTEGVQDSFVYVMGPAVQHLGAPPFVNLLAPVVNGLSHVGALDVILRLIPTCIAVYTAASTSVPMAVAIRLLCVAVRAGSARMIEALYEVMRGSSELRHLAGQPLAYAALHAGNVSAMRGWVEVGSPVAETIERTLQTAEGGVRRREAVLIPFYILLQRYEDALQICSSTTAADATQAQRLQVVQSYLRSFLSASSEAWGEKKSTVGADVDPRLPVDGASSLPLWRPTTLAAPLLQVGFCKLAEQLARAALSVGEHSSTNGATSAPASRALAEASAAYQSLYGAPANGLQTHARPPVFRPSTLLSSVERGSGAGSSSSPCSPPGAASSSAFMKDPSHVTASSASHPSITRTGTPIPWLPLSPPSLVGSSAGIPSSASERWKAALQCVPCLRSIEEGSTWTVYRPPTVIQLSEATGCSVSKLAHAYSDLPVITLNKIASTGDQETPAAELDLNFDGFEYLQLSPTDDSLEMAAKALMARRPVPDAEEIFWERTYWEVLRKAKQQMMEKKERSRNKKRLQREKKAMARVSQSSFMMPSPNVGPAPTSSTINSPSFTTPHSRQGSMGGPFSECVDRSPANLPHQTAAQRTARGLLRRARYNETHNPIQRGFMRSLSLVSQGSATQSSIRCRTHRRHDSITSQNTLTGARGFQYPLSSVASDDGRSATSDSLRTPLLHLIQSCRSRELLATSLELDLSTSCDPTNNGITTHSGLALVEGAKADTPATSEVLPPHNTGDLFTPPCNVARKYQTSGVVAASPILSASIQTSQNRRSSGQPLGNTNSLLCSDTTPPKSRIMHKGCATHALGVAPTPSPNLGLSAPHCVLLSLLENGNGDERSSSSPSPAGLKQKPAEKQPSKTERGGNKCRGGSAPQVLLLQPQPRSLAKMQRRSNGRASSGACSEALDVQPSSRCTTARPSVGSTHAPATGSVSSRPLVGTQGTLPLCASRDNLTEGMPKARSSLTGRSLAAQEVIVRSSKVSVNALPTAADTRAQGNGGKPAVTRVDIKPLPPNANSTQPLPGRHLDGGSASVQAFRCPLTPPRTTAATAAISYTPPHPAVSSSAVRSVTVPRAAAVPALSAPVPKPLQATAAVMLPSITLTPATTASSLSSSVTPRATAPTLPSSRIPTREASVPLRTECTAPAMRAALPTAPEGSPDTTPPTSTSVTNSLFPARKLSFAVAAPSKGVEAPLASRQSTTAVTSLKDARCDETKPPSLVSSTASKADTVPPQVGNDGADKSAAIRSPSTLTAPPVACAGCHSRIVPESGATDASPPSKKKAKHKAPDCCAVL